MTNHENPGTNTENNRKIMKNQEKQENIKTKTTSRHINT